MLPDEINDEEFLFRLVIANPSHWKSNENRPSSAIFKDSKGVSVDRDGGRSDDDCADFLEDKLGKGKAVVKINVGFCRSKSILVTSDPLEENPYHAVLQRSEVDIELTASQAKFLARNCELVRENPRPAH